MEFINYKLITEPYITPKTFVFKFYMLLIFYYSCTSIQQSYYLFKGSYQNLLENIEEAVVLAESWKEAVEEEEEEALEEEALVEAAAEEGEEAVALVTEVVIVEDLEVVEAAVDLIDLIQVEVEEAEEDGRLKS